jgi:protein-S-isoprenylcysteine O-methyltransferase Ste14
MTKLNFFTICWWLFIIIWLISAFSVKPAKERQDWGGKFFTFVFLTVMFLLLAGEIRWFGINSRIWPYDKPLLYLAYTLTLAGLAILVWSRLSLGTNWSATVTFRDGHELVERGPYRFVRHPMYTGMMLMVAGTAVVLGNLSGLLSHWPSAFGGIGGNCGARKPCLRSILQTHTRITSHAQKL